MADIKQYEPLWGSWHVEAPLGEGAFGKVYRVKKEEFGKTYYSAVKILSIPQNEADLRQARSEGLDEASARSYFHAFVMDIIQEVDLMSAFRGNSNFVSLEDHKVIEKENEIGWDILIRMELLTSLSEYAAEHPLTPDETVKLGVHICRALELCALRKTVHRDIKPDNIFVSQYGEFKLGDFGIARQIERTLSGLSKKGTETYMAPEVFRGEEYGASVDLYSLGIVMYRYLNRNRPPFFPAFPEPVMPRDREEALQRRMKGEAPPPLEGVDPALNEIVLKACAFDRKTRFADAAEMREALEALAESGSYTPIPPNTPNTPISPIPSVSPPIPATPGERGPERTPAREPTCAPEKTESVFAGRLETEKTVGAEGEAPKESRVEVPPALVGKLAILSGTFFGLLGISCWLGGIRGTAAMFFFLYALCAAQCVQCALKFRHKKILNALFLPAFVLYLVYSFFFAFEVFDYHIFVMTWSLLALESAKYPSKSAQICSVLTACSIASGFMAVRALYGISAGAYHVYVSGAMAVPFLMLFVALAGLFLTREKTMEAACAALLSVQFFPAAAILLDAANAGMFSVGDTLSFIANASFVRIANLSLPVWWRFVMMPVQIFAFVPFFMLILSQTAPSLFMRVCAEENRKKFVILVLAFFAALAAATEIISTVPGYIF
ncbi:MAG: serine/threonine protein kinase [Synergistaceae bacterium]|jgi:serine/threonine protein kinase|nr:serine/threonine protein kinase [Synergistaceae bacterium]